jgi:hypothetical protein
MGGVAQAVPALQVQSPEFKTPVSPKKKKKKKKSNKLLFLLKDINICLCGKYFLSFCIICLFVC